MSMDIVEIPDGLTTVERMVWTEWKKQVERYNTYDDNVIHVTDLCRCKKRYELSRKFPFMFKVEPYFIMANLIHAGLQQWLKENYNCKVEELFSKQVGEYTITGRVDAINEDTVFEIKTAKDLKENKPYDHHVLQVQLYLWLSGRENGVIIYVTPNKFREFDVYPEFDDEEDVMLLVTNWKSPKYDWECSYCEFSSVCNVSKR